MKARVEFYKYQQDSQVLGAKDVNMDGLRGWLYFKLTIEGRMYHDMRVHLSQSFGTKYDERDESGTDYKNPIEIGLPEGSYRPRPWNTNEFRKLVEGYVRQIVGINGSGISVSGGSVTMENNVFEFRQSAEFELEQ